MQEIIRIEDKWYVLATSSRADDRTRVLKQGDTFGLFDRHGDIQPIGFGEQGLYHEGTRYLSHFELMVNEHRPLLLNSTVKEDNSLLVVDLTTPDLHDGERLTIRKGTLHLFRAKLLWEGVHYERIRAFNYGSDTADIRLELRFGADYADIFEVRGVHRERRGNDLATHHHERELLLGYRGLDDVSRRTRIGFSLPPQIIDETRAHFSLTLPAGGERDLFVTVACETDTSTTPPLGYEQALCLCTEALAAARRTGVHSSNEQFNSWLNRSAADLHMLVSRTAHGLYPYAGVPWFSTPFGRDGIIAALQYLWVEPALAQGVLGFLAATQADEVNPEQDAEPGKILHETRRGEMAALGEVPFRRYYGTVDATPLFVVLAGAYYERTADRPFIEAIWPNIERALHWIDTYGDADGDGFVEYARHSANGLVQQGWKDSDDSVFHHDGSAAEGPIAVCEVQGYVYEAKCVAARLARLFGETDRADALERQAQALRARFNAAFWCDELNGFALALDGSKRPCRVRTSNAGHALFNGIASAEYARRVAETLLSDDAFSGWGVRTVGRGEARYNPMSYHNGSIWPHDNAIVAMGLARYGFKGKAMKIVTGLFDASAALDLHRLPELFCGFDRLPGQGPTLYPVACSPQAWASGSVFQLLQACLGLSFSPEKPQLRFDHPQLPDYLHRLRIENLHVGDAVVDLAFTRHPRDVSVNVTRKEGDVEIAVIV